MPSRDYGVADILLRGGQQRADLTRDTARAQADAALRRGQAAGQFSVTLGDLIGGTIKQVQTQRADDQNRVLAGRKLDQDQQRIDLDAKKADAATKQADQKAAAEKLEADLKHQSQALDTLVNMGAYLKKNPTAFPHVKAAVLGISPQIGGQLGETYDEATLDRLLAQGTSLKDTTDRMRLSIDMAKLANETAGPDAVNKYIAALTGFVTADDNETHYPERLNLASQWTVPEANKPAFAEALKRVQTVPPKKDALLALSLTPEQRAELPIKQQDAETRALNAETDKAREARMAKLPPRGQEITATEALKQTRMLRKDFVAETQAAKTVQQQLALMESSLEAVKNGSAPAGSQGVLVTFQKILDPTSVVRESEYARSGSGLPLMSAIEGQWMKIKEGGAKVPVADLEKFVELARKFAKNQAAFANQTKEQIDELAKEYGLNPALITRDFDEPLTTKAPKDGDKKPLTGPGYPADAMQQFINGKWIRIK